MAEFLTLYRGRTVSDAELVAICADRRIVSKFFEELAAEPKQTTDAGTPPGASWSWGVACAKSDRAVVERRHLPDEQAQLAALRLLLKATGKKAAGTDGDTEDRKGAKNDPADRSIPRRS